MKKFCSCQYKQKGKSKDLFCEARLSDIPRIGDGKCPFTLDNLTYEHPYTGEVLKENKQLIARSFIGTKYADGVCRDFKPLKKAKYYLVEIAKRNTEKLPTERLIRNL